MSYLKVITGPMYSGKSEELIRLIRRAEYGQKKYLCVKPHVDTRQDNIRARELSGNGLSVTAEEKPAFAVFSAAEFNKLIKLHQPQILFIDEAQFFDKLLIDEIKQLLMDDSEIKVYAAGLDQQAWGQTFRLHGRTDVHGRRSAKDYRHLLCLRRPGDNVI